jgi:YHS domain-containing protein
MTKILILIIVGYLCFRAMKNWMSGSGTSRKEVSPGAVGEIDDIMVKDPSCGIYFPKKDGIHMRYKGEDLYFCSESCKEAYTANNLG